MHVSPSAPGVYQRSVRRCWRGTYRSAARAAHVPQRAHTRTVDTAAPPHPISIMELKPSGGGGGRSGGGVGGGTAHSARATPPSSIGFAKTSVLSTPTHLHHGLEMRGRALCVRDGCGGGRGAGAYHHLAARQILHGDHGARATVAWASTQHVRQGTRPLW
jgi:hypothetical protein